MAFNNSPKEETNSSSSYVANNTNSISLYNEKVAVLQMGYWRDTRGNDFGTLRLSPAFATPQENKVYNYDKNVSVFFSLNAKDLVKIQNGIMLLDDEESEVSNFAIKHFGDKLKTILIIGNDMEGYDTYINLIELNENNETIKDLMFNFTNDSEDGMDTLLVNIDPESLEGEAYPLSTEFEVFKSYLNSVERVINKESQHLPEVLSRLDGSPRSTGTARDSKIVTPEKKLRERKISPTGTTSRKTSKKIESKEQVSAIFDDEDEE